MGLSVSVETKKKFAELLFFSKATFFAYQIELPHFCIFMSFIPSLYFYVYAWWFFLSQKNLLWFSKRSFLGTTMSSKLGKYCLPITFKVLHCTLTIEYKKIKD